MQNPVLFNILAGIFFAVYFTIAYRASKRTGTNLFKIAFLLGVRRDSPLVKKEKRIIVVTGALMLLTFMLTDPQML